LDRWLEGRQVGPEPLDLVRRQFDFYARKLCVAYSCGADISATDDSVVKRAQSFLLTFTGPERIYGVIVAAASEHNAVVRFAPSPASAAAVLADAYEVPGAFTPAGWRFMKHALANPDSFVKAEDWVLGAQAGVKLEHGKLVD